MDHLCCDHSFNTLTKTLGSIESTKASYYRALSERSQPAPTPEVIDAVESLARSGSFQRVDEVIVVASTPRQVARALRFRVGHLGCDLVGHRAPRRPP